MLTEPTTAITDLILAILGGLMAWGASAHYESTGSGRSRWYRIGFMTLALGSFLGFVSHGFATGLDTFIWYLLRFNIGVAVLSMCSAAVEGVTGPGPARRWQQLVLVAFVIYYIASSINDNFIIFILYSGSAMLVTLALEAYRWLARGGAGGVWMTLGVLTSIVAAGLQASKLTLTLVWEFDHNGIYHLVQTVALLIIYRGVTAPRAPARG